MLTIKFELQKRGEDIYFLYPNISNMNKRLEVKINISQLLQENDHLNEVLQKLSKNYDYAVNQNNQTTKRARIKIENPDDQDNALLIIDRIKLECKKVFSKYILPYKAISKKYENIFFVVEYDSDLSNLVSKLQLHHLFIEIKNSGLTYAIKTRKYCKLNSNLSSCQVINKENRTRIQQIYGDIGDINDINKLKSDNDIWSKYGCDRHMEVCPPIESKLYDDIRNHTNNNYIEIVYYKSHHKLQKNPAISNNTEISVDSFITILDNILNLKIAILLCCESFLLAQKLIEEGVVDYVIATTSIITDSSIRNFIDKFLHKCNVDDGRAIKPISSLVLEAQAEAFHPDQEHTVDVNSIVFIQASGAPPLFWKLAQISNNIPQVNLKSVGLIAIIPIILLSVWIQSYPNRQTQNRPSSSIPEKVEGKDKYNLKTKCSSIENKIILNNKKLIPVKLTSKPISKQGQSSTDIPLGYQFFAKKGQVITYQINSRSVCNWLYDPDLNLLAISSDNNKLPQNSENPWQTANLPKEGNYILQFANIKGMGTLKIEMYLSPPPSSSPKLKTQQNTANLQY